MTICWINWQGRMLTYLVSAGVIVKEFRGAPGAYGIPEDAIGYNNATHCGMVEWNGEEWVRALKKTGLISA